MPQINVMYWNVENFGDSKYGNSPPNPAPNPLRGQRLVELIARVIHENNVDIVGMSEIRSNLGQDIGDDLVNELDGITGGNWQRRWSPQFVNNRLEQYLFLWDQNTVTRYNAPNTFQHQFANPAPPPALIGFPNQSGTDRPPYLGYFRTVAPPQRNIPIAAFHAPRPSPWFYVRNGNRKLADVQEFQNQGHACIVMGDFNVAGDSNAGNAGSRGAEAFAAPYLVAQGFTQLLPNRQTSLITANAAFVGMVIGDCYSQGYDKFFFRNNPHHIAFANEGVDELIQECVAGSYLEDYLRDLEDAVTGALPMAYNTVEEAFVAFRNFVSDHMPIIMEVHY